jgi:hypothetical protein
MGPRNVTLKIEGLVILASCLVLNWKAIITISLVFCGKVNNYGTVKYFNTHRGVFYEQVGHSSALYIHRS